MRMGGITSATTTDEASENDQLLQCVAGTSPSSFYSVDEAIEAIGFGSSQFWTMVVIGLNEMAAGAATLTVVILGPAIVCELGISKFDEAVLTATTFVGMSVGTVFWGCLADRYGRKGILQISTCFWMLAQLAGSGAATYRSICLCRFLFGFGFTSSIANSLLAETLPSSCRGKIIVAMFSFFWPLGGVLMSLSACWIMPAFGWHQLLQVAALPICVVLLLSWTLDESPHYLAIAGQNNKASQVLRKMAQQNNRPMPAGSLRQTHQTEEGEHLGEVSQLFRPPLLRILVCVFALWIIQVFEYFGAAMLATELNLAHESSAPALHSTSGLHTSTCKPLTAADLRDNTITNAGELVGAIVPMLLVDVLGRRRTQLILWLSAGMGFLALLLPLSRQLITVFNFCIRLFVIGAGSVLHVYTPEVFPTSVRVTAFGLSTGIGRLGGMTAPFVVDMLTEKMEHGVLLLFGGLCFLAALCVLLCRVETMGKSLSEQDSSGNRITQLTSV